MFAAMPYKTLANAVLALHFLIVIFVVGGLLLIVAGNLVRWRWVNALWFRLSHLVAIGVVVVQSWAGVDCPLTTLESWLRGKAGASVYSDSFIEHWLGQWLYYDAPWWTFVAAYSLFGMLVAAAWWRFPPRRGKPGRENPA
jgi:hypothetical protein